MMILEGARRLEAMKRAPVADLSPEEAQKGSRSLARASAPFQEQNAAAQTGNARASRAGLLMRCR
jgi:hypothetical protein